MARILALKTERSAYVGCSVGTGATPGSVFGGVEEEAEMARLVIGAIMKVLGKGGNGGLAKEEGS